jgi:hypothetical protein
MKQYLCMHCRKIGIPEDECFIDEDKFVEHLVICHHANVTSLTEQLLAMKILGVYEERDNELQSKN